MDAATSKDRTAVGIPLFAYGYRPFFLAAGLYGCIAMGAWLVWLALHLSNIQVVAMTTALAPFVWHAHEMVFGFVPAVIAGFLLTAVPSWTDAPPLRGAPLAALAGLWLVGRAAIWFSAYLPAAAVAALDLAFLPALMGAVAVPLVKARAWRNTAFLFLLALFTAANLLVHLEALGVMDDGAALGHLLGIDLVALLIAIVGGRVTPSFTQNWLQRRGGAAVVRHAPLDRLALLAVASVAVADAAAAPGWLTGILALAAAAGLLARMAGWRAASVLGEPLLWILHLGLVWLAAAFALRALALLSGILSEVTALHLLTVGAVGSMTLGVMSRAALGHSGRPLEVAPSITAAYVLVSLAAVVRVAGPAVWPGLYGPAMLASGALWALAFAIFAAVYWPILTRPRVDGLPG